MRTIKMIIDFDINEFERKINDYLDIIDGETVEDIKYSTFVDDDSIYYSAMIIY